MSLIYSSIYNHTFNRFHSLFTTVGDWFLIRDWSLITGRGGAREVLPLQKGGAEKVLAILKGGHKKFWGCFYAVA